MFWGRSCDKAQVAHWMLNVGMIDEVKDILEDKETRREVGIGLNGLRLRMERHKAVAKNPSQETLKFSEKAAQNIINNSIKEGIILEGGIGDIIEDLSIIEAWGELNRIKLKYTMTKSKHNIMERFLRQNGIETKMDKKGVLSKILITAMGDEIKYPKEFAKDKTKENIKDKYICCWTAVGSGDKLSAFIRSVKFKDVYNFYKEKIADKNKIIDISNWKEWEKKSLENLGVQTYETGKGDLLDLANMVEGMKKVISIDTALIHLSAVMGKERILLLAHHHDERWKSYLKTECCYSQKITVYRQKNAFDWKTVLRSIDLNI